MLLTIGAVALKAAAAEVWRESVVDVLPMMVLDEHA
jgi:hypothetical protein